MKRFSPILRRALRNQMRTGDLSAQQYEAVARLLAARGKRAKEAWNEITQQLYSTHQKLQSACRRAEEEDDDTPIWDWIKNHWRDLLAVIVAIVSLFLL